MSTAKALLDELEALGVDVWEDLGYLRFKGPRHVMTDERKDALRQFKTEILSMLAANDKHHDAHGVVLRYEIDGKEATAINRSAESVEQAVSELRGFYFPPDRVGRIWWQGAIVFPVESSATKH